MPKTEADIRASLDAVIEDIEKSQRVYGWFAGNVGDLARATRSLASTLERRCDHVDLRLDRLDQRFEQVDQRFEQVDQRFEQVDQRFEQVDQRFDGLDQRLDTFERNTETQFGLVHDGLRKLDARMERLVGYVVRDELAEEADAPSAG